MSTTSYQETVVSSQHNTNATGKSAEVPEATQVPEATEAPEAKGTLFSKLRLCDPLIQATKECGYLSATPIQQEAIPAILSGRDVMAGAQTGTGKTAAFALPILHRMSSLPFQSRKKRVIKTLILAPTRELASQVEENFKVYASHLPLKSAVIFGGVKIEAQIHKLQRGFDILVATPGRLLDHLQRKTIDLSQVTTLVLDEADRMLDMGFIHDINKIIQRLPRERQNLLFSATYTDVIKKLVNKILINPVHIQVAPKNSTAARVAQVVHPVARHRKRELLSYLIGSKNWHQVLVFVRTKHGADRLCKQLIADGLRTIAIHGNKTQAARKRALAEFKAGSMRVLVATDIAARGIDIDNLPFVVNYDLPDVPEDYVHRIGRTGRAGKDGLAVTLACEEDVKALSAIENLLKRKIKQNNIEGYEIDLTYALKPKQKANSKFRRESGTKSGMKEKFKPKSKANRNSKFKSKSNSNANPIKKTKIKSNTTKNEKSKGRGTGKPNNSSSTTTRKRTGGNSRSANKTLRA